MGAGVKGCVEGEVAVSNKEFYLKAVGECLAKVAVETIFNNAIGLLDGNRSNEYLYCDLLNAIFGWQLENANIENQNNPGFDLIDTRNKILVQVSSRINKAKIDQSLQHIGGYCGYHLYCVSLVPMPSLKHVRPVTAPSGIQFDRQEDVLDPRAVAKLCNGLDVLRLKNVYEVCRAHCCSLSAFKQGIDAPTYLSDEYVDMFVYCFANVYSHEELLVSYCDEFIEDPESEGGKARRTSVNGVMGAQLHSLFVNRLDYFERLIFGVTDHYEIWNKLRELSEVQLMIDCLPKDNDEYFDVKSAKELMTKEMSLIEETLRLVAQATQHPEQVCWKFNEANR